MEKIVEQSFLYDFYGELLTQHQKQVYEDVVFNDLSLSEIAKEQGISRQGVYDLVKRCDKLLKGYEDKLHLVEKFLLTKEKISEIHACASSIKGTTDVKEISQKIEEIEHISNFILEHY